MQKKKQRLSPLLKYPGGKERELKHILPYIPKDSQDYYEPFVGGGAVFFSLDAEHYYINDRSEELMALYRFIAEQSEKFFAYIERIDRYWMRVTDIIKSHDDDLKKIYSTYRENPESDRMLTNMIYEFTVANSEEFNGLFKHEFNYDIEHFLKTISVVLKRKIKRMRTNENQHGSLNDQDILLNIEAGLKAGLYTHYRHLYNHAESYEMDTEYKTALFLYMREYCYSSMFRYNTNNHFNVPYGGISYNAKSLRKKIDYYKRTDLLGHLKKTTFGDLDFLEFLEENRPNKNDFLFIDPPYDTDFSTYARNAFGSTDQERLANYLIKDCPARFMVVIKRTSFIESIYPPGKMTAHGKPLTIEHFDKNYSVSFKNRNDRSTQHLRITNY
jgi:DNA adenine methylase